MATETKVIEYDKENSQLRQELEDFISSRGVMQKHILKSYKFIYLLNQFVFE